MPQKKKKKKKKRAAKRSLARLWEGKGEEKRSVILLDKGGGGEREIRHFAGYLNMQSAARGE